MGLGGLSRRRAGGAWLVGLVLTLMATASAQAAAPSVTVTGGLIIGAQSGHDGAVFLGIPYAAPPVGALRWRPPQPVSAWTAPRLATDEPSACPQSSYGAWNAFDAAHASEDCLYLDVRTPRLDPTARLPVMVWIHGGGNRAGSMRGTVRAGLVERGVVLVALQYRLGALGFMAHPGLTADGPDHASGEYGLMDQIAALKWVRDNIARFGGDPNNVTIFGESAGAQDVGLLNLAPAARGLFAKAIEESGTADFGLAPLSLGRAEQIGRLIAQRAGAPSGASAADLRALPVAALLKAADQAPIPGLGDASYVWLDPVVDGVTLPQSPEAVLGAGLQPPVPLIVGANARELTLYWPTPQDGVRERFGARAGEALALYGLSAAAPPPADPRLGDVATQIADDATFRCPMVHLAASQARAGAPVWVYHYDRSPASGLVNHGAELASVFGDGLVSPPGAAKTYSLADYWVAFAKTGDPNAPDLAIWPRQGVTSAPYLAFTDQGPVIGHDLRQPICRLLKRF